MGGFLLLPSALEGGRGGGGGPGAGEETQGYQLCSLSHSSCGGLSPGPGSCEPGGSAGATCGRRGCRSPAIWSLLLSEWRAGRWNFERPQSRVCAGGRAPAPFPAFLPNKYLHGLFGARARLQVLGVYEQASQSAVPAERPW